MPFLFMSWNAAAHVTSSSGSRNTAEIEFYYGDGDHTYSAIIKDLMLMRGTSKWSIALYYVNINNNSKA